MRRAPHRSQSGRSRWCPVRNVVRVVLTVDTVDAGADFLHLAVTAPEDRVDDLNRWVARLKRNRMILSGGRAQPLSAGDDTP